MENSTAKNAAVDTVALENRLALNTQFLVANCALMCLVVLFFMLIIYLLRRILHRFLLEINNMKFYSHVIE